MIHNRPVWTGVKPWHPLTEIPRPERREQPAEACTVVGPSRRTQGPPQAGHAASPLLVGASPPLIRLLYDVMTYPYSSVSVRIKRLGVSARAFETAKLEGCEKGLIFESAAGATTYLIPLPKALEAMGFPCPYDRNQIEHSYYLELHRFLLAKDPANKSVHTEFRVGDSGSTGDIVTIGHDGTRRAYEITLSTGNILSNASKYSKTDYVQIIFLCRDYRLREAVKACCREGGLDPELLGKLEFIQFSTLLNRQRKLSLY